MATTQKRWVQLAMVICIFGFVLLFRVPNWSNAMWGWRIGLGLGVIVTGLICVRADNRKEKLPDLLAKRIYGLSYFECEGLCFWPEVQATENVCWIAIFFQNRYAGPCSCSVEMLPPRGKFFWFERNNLPPINAELNCPGGAFGVCRIPYAVPAQDQGRRWRFDIYASTQYPQGRGKMLRFRSGMLAGPRSTAFFTLSPGRQWYTLNLPLGVQENIGASLAPITEILWQPDLPTHAFPIIPTVENRG